MDKAQAHGTEKKAQVKRGSAYTATNVEVPLGVVALVLRKIC
jgi:hypothetical protein